MQMNYPFLLPCLCAPSHGNEGTVLGVTLGAACETPCFQSGAHPQLQLNVGALSPLLLFCPDAFGPCSIHPNRLILIFVKLSEDCRLQHYLGRVFKTITKKRKPG